MTERNEHWAPNLRKLSDEAFGVGPSKYAVKSRLALQQAGAGNRVRPIAFYCEDKAHQRRAVVRPAIPDLKNNTITSISD